MGVPSALFRWRADGLRTREDGSRAYGLGFEFAAAIPTRAAAAMQHAALPGTQGLLLVANGQGQDAQVPGAATVDVYSTGRGRNLTLLQQIPSMGAADVAVFEIEDQHFVAVANRQSRAPADASDAAEHAVYDQQSEILRWDRAAGRFVHHQMLGPETANASNESHFRSIFEATAGSPAPEAFGALRGATGFTPFEARGEFFLMVAQSVCEFDAGRAQCLAEAGDLQPRSAVLQWDRAAQRFGPLLSVTRHDDVRLRGAAAGPLSAARHAWNMRIAAGRARRGAFVSVDDWELLLICSLTKGVVAYRWAFNQTAGLAAPAGAAPALQGDKVYAVGRAAPAIVVLERGSPPPTLVLSGHAASLTPY